MRSCCHNPNYYKEAHYDFVIVCSCNFAVFSVIILLLWYFHHCKTILLMAAQYYPRISRHFSLTKHHLFLHKVWSIIKWYSAFRVCACSRLCSWWLQQIRLLLRNAKILFSCSFKDYNVPKHNMYWILFFSPLVPITQITNQSTRKTISNPDMPRKY